MDPYTNPDEQSERTLAAMITRLEERGRHPMFLQMIRDYAGELPVDQPLALIEIGCGTGAVLRELKNLLHPASDLHGADVSEVLLNHARKQDEGQLMTWIQSGPGPLPYAEQSFDVVVMHTLLSHVPDTGALLSEAARLLRPGGRLVVFDADHAGTTYGLPDYESMRRTDHLLSSAIARHPDVCRQMPRLLKEAGFQLVNHRSHIHSECGQGDYWLSSVRGFIGMLPSLGVLSAAEGEAWAGHMLRSHDEGTFFAAGAFYTFVAGFPSTPADVGADGR